MIKAATLAVGTEVTDGQIIDRNSAWISAKLVSAGIQVIEHRAVADDRADIERALRELTKRVGLLFVTGGLGPTSDDFTRDVLAKTFGLSLEFDPESWRQVGEKLASRGIAVREIQRQQCFFPQGARVLFNPAGTANGFSFKTADAAGVVVFALPGPPVEIAAVWEQNLESEIQSLTPTEDRDELTILRFLGRGESDIAEVAEAIIKDSGFVIGYRAHVPYVEVKLWYPVREKAKAQAVLSRLEESLKPWLVNRNDDDVLLPLIDVLKKGEPVVIRDFATQGLLQERISQKLRELKLVEDDLPLTIETSFAASTMPSRGASADTSTVLSLTANETAQSWEIRLKKGAEIETVLEAKPAYNYKVRSERGRKFIIEKALHLLGPCLR